MLRVLFRCFVISIISALSLYGQKDNIEIYNQKDIDNYKILDNVYNFWWYKNDYRWFPKRDTLPYLVDDRRYIGLKNYGIDYSSRDRKNLAVLEHHEMYNLKINFERCSFSIKDSTVVISGSISGGWPINNSLLNGKKNNNNVNVFIGKVRDTMNLLYLNSILHPESVVTTYKGREVNSHIVLDTFPSKYIYSYKKFSTDLAKERKFKISSKVDKNSVLIFGLVDCFSEIFEIGDLFYSSKSKKRNRKTSEFPYLNKPKIILRNNNLVNEKNKFNNKPKYYEITEMAERYILQRKYAQAKEEYGKFIKENKYVFARDIHNAVRCAVLARDYKAAVEWSKKLALKGVELSYFDDNLFNQLKKEHVWEMFLKEYDSLYNQFQEGLNKNLIDGLNNLVDEDQKYYNKSISGDISSVDLANRTEYLDSLFINLLHEEGLPTEEKIGIRMNDHNIISTTPLYFILQIHSFKMRSSKFQEIDSLLNKMHHEIDNYRNNLDNFRTNGNTCLKIYKGNLYNNKKCGDNLWAIQKMKFLFDNRYNFIIDTGEYTIIPYDKNTEEQDENRLKENAHFVIKLTEDWFFYEKP